MHKFFEDEEPVTGAIVGRVKGGFTVDLGGINKNITDYGAFVDLGGIDGLLHVTDMSWRRVSHPSQVLNVGDTVAVKIIRINPETQRISLGMRSAASRLVSSRFKATRGTTSQIVSRSAQQ